MQIRPTYDEVRKIAAEGKYDVLPLSVEILSDFTTPIEALKILKNASDHVYMLESAQANETWGRYTFLGFKPRALITCKDGILEVDGEKIETKDPSAELRKIMSGYKSPRFDYLPPFAGGLVGYFSYDYLTYSEPCEITVFRSYSFCVLRASFMSCALRNVLSSTIAAYTSFPRYRMSLITLT